jgi:pyruvate/2-oxoglutarate dehydrogenase complex dihydrolipoamide acyltransferase (E2) component
MSTEVLLPRLGFTVSEGSIAEWLKEDGAAVTAGEPLYSLEADKAVTEIEAPASGRLKIIIQTGEAHPVGTILAVIE